MCYKTNIKQSMLLNLIFIIVGIVLVLWGADRLTEGSAAVRTHEYSANRYPVSPS